jgi:GGDEF domain-containing protein
LNDYTLRSTLLTSSTMVVFDGSKREPGQSAVTSFPTFANWDAFAGAEVEPLGFYLQNCDSVQQHAIAAAVRQSRWWSLPVVVDEGHRHSALVDAEGSAEVALRLAAQSVSIRESVPLDPAAMQFDERILYFLYLRDGALLTPVRDRTSTVLYRYPLADALAGPQDDVAAHLDDMTRKGLLEPLARIDRTRMCRSCNSAHIHYVEVCPHCHSLQIDPCTSVHCFTCGLVAPEEEFKSERTLSCPKCYAGLRHIGVDYDRPLTQYTCSSCNKPSMEGKVVARCLDCAAEADPSDLDVRDVAPLRLSSQGRAAIRAGQLQASFAALDSANSVLPDYFRHMLSWALATSTRHSQLEFALVMVRFPNLREITQHTNATRVILMLQEFSSRMQSLLRETDVTTRMDDEVQWMLLPFSSMEGVVARIHQFADEQQKASPDGVSLRVEVRAAQLPADAQKDESAESLMTRMQRN